MTEKLNYSENSKKEFIEAIEFWRDRIIRSCGLPPKIVTISTQYNIASGTSETEQITWSREVSNYGVHYNPETIENWETLRDRSVERDSSHAISGEFYEPYSVEQIAQIRDWLKNKKDVKTSCKYYDNNPHLRCAIDPNLNCGQCSHYEYLDPAK